MQIQCLTMFKNVSVWREIGAVEVDSFLYLVGTSKQKWSEGRKTCNDLGGDLAQHGKVRGCEGTSLCDGASVRQ